MSIPVVKLNGTCVVCGHAHDDWPCPEQCEGCGCLISNGEISPGCEVCLRFLEWEAA